jgi:hypothetical protein
MPPIGKRRGAKIGPSGLPDESSSVISGKNALPTKTVDALVVLVMNKDNNKAHTAPNRRNFFMVISP